MMSDNFEKHLSQDNWSSTDKQCQVVRVDGVKIKLLSDGKPEDCPDGAVNRHVGNETGLRKGGQRGFGIVGGRSFVVDLLLGASAVG